eukprot:m.196116 g.196116  ORF g.196116 m.196116 type:complete len:2530 (-) comp10628_c0_seq6:379-7968(-)
MSQANMTDSGGLHTTWAGSETISVPPICFGDRIALYDNGTNGFVFCNLTTGGSVVAHSGTSVDRPDLGNFKHAVFEVRPRSKYKANRALEFAVLEARQRLGPKLDIEKLAERQPSLRQLQREAAIEDEDNFLETRRRRGDPVHYGQIVQFFHEHSKRFLRISTTQTSQLEMSHMHVDLSANLSRHAWFRIMPRYKVRAEGDIVRLHDQIVIESLKTPGQFLHTSEGAFRPQTPNGGCHEINLSVLQSSFVVHLHNKFRENTETLLRAGDCIQLFHKEISAFVAAEGVFIEDKLSQGVHMRIRTFDPKRPHRLLPPTSAVSFWQVESATRPIDGEILTWEDIVRFRHIPTQRYLSFEKVDGEIVPALLDEPDTACNFQLHAVIQERDTIEFGIYSRIQHVQTRRWLHAQQDKPVRRAIMQSQETDALSMRLSKIQWDRAPLVELRTTEMMMFDDAFIISKVPDELVYNVAIVSGTLPILRHYPAIRRQRELTSREAAKFCAALEELRAFMYIREVGVRQRQKLLRNLRVIELLVDMLKSPFAPFNTSPSAITLNDLHSPEKRWTRSVLENVYSLLQAYLDGNSRKNELYIARHISFFLSQAGGHLPVEPMVTELVRDNRTVIQCMSETEMRKFIDLLAKEKNPAYLDFLSVLCTAESGPIPHNQDIISRFLLEQGEACVFLTELKGDRVVVNMTGNDGDWIPLREFCHSAMDEDDSTSTREFLFLQKQFDLFDSLAAGRNQHVIQIITKELRYLTWEECFCCARDEQLPKSLRAKYVGLMVSLFVNVDPNINVLEEVQLAFKWDEIQERPYANLGRGVSICGTSMPFFDELSSWLEGFLKAQGSIVVSDRPSNLLLTAILNLLYNLVMFGYYKESNISGLVPGLRGIIDGRNDILYLKRKSAAAADDKQFLNEWRDVHRFRKSPDNKVVTKVKFQAIRVMQALFNYSASVRIQRLLFDFKQVYERVAQQQDGRRPSRLNPRTGRAVIENLIKMENEANIFNFTTASREYLGSIINSSNFITPDWVPGQSRNGHPVLDVLFDLSRYNYSNLLTESLDLITQLHSSHSHLFEYCVRTQILIEPESAELSEYLYRACPRLHRIAKGYIEPGEVDAFLSELEKIHSYCYLNPAKKTPHPVNQVILFNSGLVHILLDVISRRGQYARVLSAVFSLLQALSIKHDSVQQLLFQNLDSLLDCQSSESGWQNEMARAVAEIFTHNHKLCLQVKPHHVQRLAALLSEHTLAMPDILRALQAVSKVEELNIPLKRNQNFIVKYLMEYRSKVIAIALIDDASDPDINRQRMELLRQGPKGKNAALLKYHVNLVSLLASCAEGENRYIESMCQTIFSVSELIEVLSDRNIDPSTKRGYINFFVWAYLNTAGHSVQIDDIRNLASNQQYWACLEALTSVPTLSSKLELPLTQEAEEYLFDSLLPLLLHTVKEHYVPDRFPSSHESLIKIVSKICAFIDAAGTSMTNHSHIKMLSSFVMTCNNRHAHMIPPKTIEFLSAKLMTGDAGLLESEEEAMFFQKYSRQLELNNIFNTFVDRLRKAYSGPNTVECQLAHLNVPQTVAKNAYCEVEGSDEALPLSPEFQAHVTCFIKGLLPSGGLDLQRIQALLKQLDKSIKYAGIRDSKRNISQARLDQRTLLILRAILHNTAKLGNEARFTQLQNELAEAGVVLPVAMMMPTENMAVVQEALACVVILLRNGNRAVQASFEQYFMGTREELFFIDMQSRIRASLERLQELRLLRRLVHEERDRHAQLMGTMTLAGSKGLKHNLDQKEAEASRFQPSTDNPYELEMIALPSDRAIKPVAPVAELEVRDEGNIELVLRILQNMCEGQNDVLKSYLHRQPDNIRSIDLVAQTSEYLHVVTEEISAETIDLTIQTLETLVEFAQGNHANQGVIFDAQVVDTINRILVVDSFFGIDEERTACLKTSCGKLLGALIEDSDQFTRNMVSELEETLNIAAIVHNMRIYYAIHQQGTDRLWTVDETSDREPSKAVDVSYLFYNILMRMKDFTGKSYHKMPKYQSFLAGSESEVEEENTADPATLYFEENSVSIEVMRWDRIQKIHFLNKWRHHLRPEVKSDLLWHVDRSSPTDKIRDFVDRCQVIIADIDYMKYILDKNKLTRFFVRHSKFWGNCLILLTFLLNIALLVNFDAELEDVRRVKPIFRYDWYKPLLYIGGGLHLLLCLIVSITFFFMYPLSLSATIRSIPFVGNSLADRLAPQDSLRTQKSFFNIAHMYHVGIVGLSLLALIFSGYFYCGHLFHIVVNNDILLRVIRSVTKNGKSLLWVAALMVIVIYVYSLLVFAFLRGEVSSDDGAFCETAWQCFITSLKLGLMSGGGLGEALEPETETFRTFGIRTIFDLSFFVIITIIGLNVVFGIIVDTFSELRDEKYQIEETMESECFICSLKNYDFERFGNGFQTHVEKEHHMWNYLFFLAHIYHKPETEFTSHEQYINDLLEKQATTEFFPINRALALQHSDDQQVGVQIDEMKSMLATMVNRVERTLGRIVQQSQRNQLVFQRGRSMTSM